MVALRNIGRAGFHGAMEIRLAGFVAILALTFLSPLSLNNARAACSTNAPNSGDTVNCTGTDNTGVVNNAADNVTVTVDSGATINVPGGGIGIELNDQNTITNYGRIVAGDGDQAINVQNGNTIINIGSIVVGNTGGYGIQACCDNTIINRGTITVGDSSYAIYSTDRNTITNFGTINLGSNSYGIIGDDGFVNVTTNTTITNSGTIKGGDSTTGIFGFSNYNIVNSGTIELGDNGIGIRGDDGVTISNSGTVKVGAGGTGVNLNAFGGAGVNTFTNTGSVIAGNGGYGVFMDGDNAVVTNYGLIRATGGGYSLYACNCTFNNTVTNYGTLDGAIRMLDPGGGHVLNNYGLVTITDTPAVTSVGQFFSIGGTFNQFAGGVFAPRVDSLGTADGLTVDGTNLAGTIKAMIQPGLYGPTTLYTSIVYVDTSNGGNLNGTFDTVTTSSPFFTAAANYITGGAIEQVDLTITRTAFNAVPGMTINQLNVGNALEPLYSTTLTGDAATFFSNLLAATSLGALDALSGEGLSQAQSAAFHANQLFGSTMLAQINAWLAGNPAGGGALAYAQADAKPIPAAFKALEKDQRIGGWRVWMAGFFGQSWANGELPAGSADARATTGGGAFGVDKQIAPDMLAGVAVGASDSKFKVADRATEGDIPGGHIAAYGVKTWGAFYTSGSVGYARFDNSTIRPSAPSRASARPNLPPGNSRATSSAAAPNLAIALKFSIST